MLFEYEKERAKWQLERDNLVSQKSEMNEQIERLSLKKDQLLRENEKLRAENKGNRSKGYTFAGSNLSNVMGSSTNLNLAQQQQQTASMSQHNTSASATRYMVGKSIGGGVQQSVLN